MFRSSIVTIAVFLLLCAACLAGTTASNRPLQPTVLEAKTIFIDNETGINSLTVKASNELKAWGRYSVVADASKADLILTISSDTRLSPDSDDESGEITLQIMIPHDDIPQFSYTQITQVRFMESEVSRSLKILRKRIEDQERASHAAGMH